MKKISHLHYITTAAKLAMKALEGGVDWIQLRLKNIGFEEYKEAASEVSEVCRQHNATLIINDNVPLAKLTNADGVHLGKSDMPPAKAREILGNNFIIGCTANTVEDILRLAKEPIDYIGLGPFRFTTTKENLSPILGLDGYKNIFKRLSQSRLFIPPIIGIGGIGESDLHELLSTGLHGIAVSGAISAAPDPAYAARSFNHIINYNRQSILHE